MLRYIDLFTGTGGAALAFKNMAKPILYCDIDPYVQRNLRKLISQKLLPPAPIVSDIRDLESINSGDLLVDFIVGGSPCVGVSTIGHRTGFDHPETALFFDMMKVIKKFHPKVVIIENTPGMLNKESMDIVTTCFSSMKYSLSWTIIPAFIVGSPQNRKRWFCVAHQSDSRHILSQLYRSLSKAQDTIVDWSREPVERMIGTKQPCLVKRCLMIGNAIVPAQLRCGVRLILGNLLTGSRTPIESTIHTYPREGCLHEGVVHAYPARKWPKPNLNLRLINDTYSSTPSASNKIKGKRMVLWPTPRAHNNGHCLTLTERCSLDLATSLRFEEATGYRPGYRMNLAWVEWLMGFPPGWTDADA